MRILSIILLPAIVASFSLESRRQVLSQACTAFFVVSSSDTVVDQYRPSPVSSSSQQTTSFVSGESCYLVVLHHRCVFEFESSRHDYEY
jgi:hypothetical protein